MKPRMNPLTRANASASIDVARRRPSPKPCARSSARSAGRVEAVERIGELELVEPARARHAGQPDAPAGIERGRQDAREHVVHDRQPVGGEAEAAQLARHDLAPLLAVRRRRSRCARGWRAGSCRRACRAGKVKIERAGIAPSAPGRAPTARRRGRAPRRCGRATSAVKLATRHVHVTGRSSAPRLERARAILALSGTGPPRPGGRASTRIVPRAARDAARRGRLAAPRRSCPCSAPRERHAGAPPRPERAAARTAPTVCESSVAPHTMVQRCMARVSAT